MSVQAAADDDPVAPKTYDWDLFKRLLGYLRPYLGAAAAALGLIVVMAGLDLVGPWLTKVAIDRHIARGRRGRAGPGGRALLPGPRRGLGRSFRPACTSCR